MHDMQWASLSAKYNTSISIRADAKTDVPEKTIAFVYHDKS